MQCAEDRKENCRDSENPDVLHGLLRAQRPFRQEQGGEARARHSQRNRGGEEASRYLLIRTLSVCL